MSLFYLSHASGSMANSTYPMMVYLRCMAHSFEFQMVWNILNVRVVLIRFGLLSDFLRSGSLGTTEGRETVAMDWDN